MNGTIIDIVASNPKTKEFIYAHDIFLGFIELRDHLIFHDKTKNLFNGKLSYGDYIQYVERLSLEDVPAPKRFMIEIARNSYIIEIGVRFLNAFIIEFHNMMKVVDRSHKQIIRQFIEGMTSQWNPNEAVQQQFIDTIIINLDSGTPFYRMMYKYSGDVSIGKMFSDIKMISMLIVRTKQIIERSQMLTKEEELLNSSTEIV
jgi:hypothetical protein